MTTHSSVPSSPSEVEANLTPGSTPPPQGPETPEDKGGKITRRLVCKVLGFAGLGVLADQISGGQISSAIGLGNNEGENSEDGHKTANELSEKLDAEAKKIAAKVDAESEGLSEREKAMKVVDYCGSALFAWGIRDLLPGGHGHIHQYHYGALAALSTIKYQLSTPEEKEHLVEETKANAKAFGIISGTIVVAEGLNMDVEKAYESIKGSKPDKKDQVAIMTMLSSVLSPVATTVGSASIIKKMSSDLCDGDKDMMSICVSHVSNLSGYLLFGDPPFIAVCEKYGFAEGVKWQLETMWPLALFSMLRATYKINKTLANKAGLSGTAARQKALSDSISGVKDNIPVLAKIISQSLGNVAKYYTGADISKTFAQGSGGIEVKIGEVILDKLENLAKLPFSDEFDHSTHEEHEGMVRGDSPHIQGGNELIEGLMSNLAKATAKRATTGEPATTDAEDETNDAATENLAKRTDLRDAIESRNYDEIIRLGRELDVPEVEIFVETLKDFHDNEKVDGSKDATPESFLSRLNPAEIYKRATSVNRIKNALGHNLGDVVDVFPFQAGCVPFLTTLFKDVMGEVEKTGEFSKELFGFLLIMGFSMIADNYVACKIGLEIFPDKPQIPLIASIQGGSMTAIGNMANIAQFNLDDYPLMESVKRMGMNVDAVAVSFAWAKVLDVLKGFGFDFAVPPKAKKGVGSSEGKENVAHDATASVYEKQPSSTPEEVTKSTRGDFLGLGALRRKLKQDQAA